jgi:alpha-mannosidase
MKKILLSLTTCLYLSAFSQTDIPWLGKIKWINGYAREISGENISYFSAFPDHANIALLTRATNGKKTIEWETAPVPENLKGPYVYFSWVASHSSGTNSGTRNFDLFVNDEKLLTFTTYPGNTNTNWTYSAADSSRIVFLQKKLDGSKDAHGLAFLRLPKSRIKAGQPIRIKVIGQQQQSNDWYMTFKFSFEEKVDIVSSPFLLKNGKQILSVTLLHIGGDQDMRVRINQTTTHKLRAREGINHFDIQTDAVQQKDSVRVDVMINGKQLYNNFVPIQPVVYRELYFLHHSHTDIGYSHLQPEVRKIHNNNIDEALKMIQQTRDFPEDAKFKWNVESLWAVENYLEEATASKKEQFINAVKSGSISLSALYANILTGMSEPEETFHYTDYAKRLQKEYGLEFPAAMTSDVPGFAWTTVTALSKAGVKYFSVGSNFIGNHHPFLGDRAGHFLKAWGDKPVWWASPSGEEKVLLWAGAKGYSSWHGIGPGGVFDRGPKKIAAYLRELDASHYPYDIVQWRYNIVADNAPIDTSISRFVAAWNEKYRSPKIVLATTEKMFRDFELKYGDKIPVVKGDISPYWEDGAMSTAEEEGRNRVNSLRLQQLTTLYSMLAPQKYNEQLFDEAWKNIILFHEHTWGAHNSITKPDLPFVTEQWRIKKQFMLDADEKTNRLEQELLQPYSDERSKIIAVVNTASWKRSGAVLLATGLSAKSVKAADGTLHPIQPLSDGRRVFFARDVPALGIALYELSNDPAPDNKAFVITDSSLTNGHINISWNASNGSIATLNKDGFNYAGRFDKQGLNSFWYVAGLNPGDAQTNSNVKMKVAESGPVLTTISLQSDAPGANSLERKLSLFAGDDLVRIENWIDKKSIRSKEAVHFGFPFNSELQSTLLDAGYGSIRFIADQLPGSNMDYLYGRRWLDAFNADKGIQLLWLQTPLAEPGSMIDERLTVSNAHKNWKTEGSPGSNWFSYVMNNYWHTNYKSDQQGLSKYNYALRPHGAVNNTEMEKAAIDFTQPLLAIPLKQDMIKPGSLFELSNDRVVVTNILPEKDGSFQVRLFNPEPVATETGFRWHNLKPQKLIDVKTGQEIEKDKQVSLAALGVKELKLVF